MSAALPMHELSTHLAYALAYALQLGWHVLPLDPGTKKPLGRLVPRGFLDATTDEATIRAWWTTHPDAGIGIAMKASGLVTVDVDPRNGGIETMERLEATHGALVSDVLAFTGGGGEHRVFASGLVDGLPGKLGAGVDLKADGYIAAEPTLHPSGKRYAWEASSDPLHGAVPSTLPGWVRDLARSPMVAANIPTARLVDPKQVAELREALSVLSADDYHRWVAFGNALVELGQAGFLLWDEWSQKSAKYDPSAMVRKWRSFKPGTMRIESIFHIAQQAGWVNPMSIPEPAPALPVQQVRMAAPPATTPAPLSLLTLPGVLGLAVDWVNATSHKPQPAFAVQTVLAFACAVLGRRYVTTHRNWPSLYFLNVGKSGSGKEHAKWALEQLLEACDLGHLIGPAGYTSSSGVLSALHDQPSHVTVIDEFGKQLEEASVKNNVRARSAITTLIEAWGRSDGVLRPQGYSTFGMSSKDAAAIKERSVRNPALTLLAMTTPDAFFESIGSASARDGFLNRFVIVESEVGRQVGGLRDTASIPVPEAVIAWAHAMRAPGAAMLVNPDLNSSLAPTPTVVPIDPAAMELFRAFEAECVGRMDSHDTDGLAEMFGRCNEQAMKMAPLLALGDGAQAVQGPHAAWSINYVRHHVLRTVARLRSSVADSEFEHTKKQVLELVLGSGERGMTERDLHKSSRRFRALAQRQQVDLLNSMQFVGLVARVEVPSSSGKGRPRTAWVALDQDAEDE